MFKLSSFLCFMVFFALVELSHARDSNLFAEGKAYTLDGENLLYKEQHFRLANNQVLVKYFETDGQLFAHKILDYSFGPSTPLFEQLNSRTGEKIRIMQSDGDQIDVHYKKVQKHKAKISRVPLTSNLVIDAGFDNLVRQHWSTLQGGQILSFNYLLPTRGKAIKLNINRFNCEEKTLCLQIYPSNPLLNLIVKNLRLQYDLKSRRLVMFKGRGNISNAAGRYQDVRVRYNYFPLESKPQMVNKL